MRRWLASAVVFFACSALAQEYPARAVRVIVPFAPGGGTDIVARILSQHLSQRLGQSFVIDNRPAGSGIVGADLVAKSASDGYTLLFAFSSLSSSARLFSQLPYDPVRDFAPVALATTSPLLAVAPLSLPAKDIREFVAYARANDGKLNYGSSGPGSSPHLATELLMSITGIRMQHIAYKGIAPAVTALLADEVQFSLVPIAVGLPHIKAGRLRALGVAGLQRSAATPDIPTLNESGLPDYEVIAWWGMLAPAAHAVIVRSPHAHASIRRVATERAKGAAGVIAVLTGRDAAADGLGHIQCLIPVVNLDGTNRKDTPRPVLALDKVAHVGDPVAMVVAGTLAQARDAADLVEVDYAPLPALTDVREGEVAFDIDLGDSRDKVAAAFAKAAHVTRLELVNNRLVANPIEPRAALAEYDAATDRITLYTPSQGPHHLRGQIAAIVKNEDVRVVSGNVGGAFGMKIFLYPEQPLMAWAARRLKRAVRWTAERGESFLSDAQGRDNYSVAELAMDGNARFLALRVTTWANMGAYLSNFGPFIPQLAAPMLSGVYRIPAITLNIKGTLTNTVPVDAYRGAGRPEAIYLLERVVDAAARELGLAPDELRRRNFIPPSAMPYQTPVESRYDSGDFAAVMARAMEKAQWSTFGERKAKAGKLRGIGLAMYIERCGGGPGDTVRVKVEGDKVVADSGMQGNGQGHTTTFVQLLSHQLGIDSARIRVVQC